MAKSRSLLVVVCLVLFAPAAAWAQNSYGSISGYVMDEGGTPLKGVKVSATSDTQIGGAKAAYSNDEGAFRFSALMPGAFELRATAPKLETVVPEGVARRASARRPR